jgi:hypothetical protein
MTVEPIPADAELTAAMGTDAGAAIRRRRKLTRVLKRTGDGPPVYAQMSMRDLSARLEELEAADPYTFKGYSRGAQTEIENRGQEYILEAMRDHRMLNALIEALWDGNVAAFQRDTGIELPLIRLLRKGVPYYQEGDPHFGQRQPPKQRAPQRCEYLVEVDRTDLAPMLVPGQLVGMVRTEHRADVINQIVALNHAKYGLSLALAQPDGTLTDARGNVIPGSDFEQIVGVTAWIGRRPRKPESL